VCVCSAAGAAVGELSAPSTSGLLGFVALLLLLLLLVVRLVAIGASPTSL
jgi:hypothetical protein